ncbi:MAG: YggS family pyridoxal phosphate-dependent enzyme [Bdellovibrionales bacterium]|jgi:PLP dependent protein|nr:YggS family pyridoxal phosphate-dependent enzyme [Bdellovibrionales bacterium]MBT3526419.1 YggS family pyridoxal phosphate-dependent enzyme [Bdellovibrionales bacterium]MBT7670018.1 YggS family pyridoxal phosphate-dependent enzyme [Bdellovibrionales bacterium]MBT7768273.1 YggS family pyridoxal phosphate-dependent enzyme [Bdellovibrionales bacterium]
MEREELIASRLTILLKELEGKATLVAVSKYSPLLDITYALNAGQHDFGESRVQDLAKKSAQLNSSNIRWHFIGHLQRNKVKPLLAIPNLYSVHSVDSLRLLQELLAQESSFTGNCLKLYLQVNCSGESSKGGFSPGEELDQGISTLLDANLSKYALAGLMTMGPILTDNFESDAGEAFEYLRRERDRIVIKFSLTNLELSMGMSRDFRVALGQESDIVRIGGHIFA